MVPSRVRRAESQPEDVDIPPPRRSRLTRSTAIVELDDEDDLSVPEVSTGDRPSSTSDDVPVSIRVDDEPAAEVDSSATTNVLGEVSDDSLQEGQSRDEVSDTP